MTNSRLFSNYVSDLKGKVDDLRKRAAVVGTKLPDQIFGSSDYYHWSMIVTQAEANHLLQVGNFRPQQLAQNAQLSPTRQISSEQGFAANTPPMQPTGQAIGNATKENTSEENKKPNYLLWGALAFGSLIALFLLMRPKRKTKTKWVRY